MPTITDETIELVQQAMSARAQMPSDTRSITLGTGLTGYELEAPAKVINPVITPLVNMIPRRRGAGNPIVHWKAITSFDTTRGWGALAGADLPGDVTYSVASMQNSVQTIAKSNNVPFQAQWRGRGLEGDVRAKRTAELLYELKMTEERWLLNASQYLMTPPSPYVVGAATGGSVAAGTYYVAVTAVNANGETTMSNASLPVTTTGSTSSLKITIFTVPIPTQAASSTMNAQTTAYYNVYISSTDTARASFWLQSGVSGNSHAPQPGYNTSVALAGGGSTLAGEVQAPTIVVTQTAAVATSGTSNPPSANTAKSLVDTSSNVVMWDGLFAQALGNATTTNGLTLGAQVGESTKSDRTLQLSDLDNLLLAAYNQAAGDPDYLVMNPIQHKKLTALVVSAGDLRYVVDMTRPEDKGKVTANYRVTHYLNQSTGKEIPIIPNRYCPADSILALPMSIPYPTQDVPNAVEIETTQEYWGIDFAINDSSYRFADYVDETLKVYFLGGLCVLRGVNPAA